ncbi:hypothetical protein CGCVW01_v006921 [Colletotrichum viniferum]|nr:hypothetical protein CGCVW01_v006921 [Colletotrichum viniferum]
MRVASRHGFCLLPLPPSANNHNIVLALVPSIDASLRQGVLATYPAARAYIQRDRETRVASNAMRLPCLISRPGPQLAPSPPPWGVKSAPTHSGGSMLMLMLKPIANSSPEQAYPCPQTDRRPNPTPGQFYAPNSRQTPIFTIPPANVVRPLSGRPLFWTHETGFMASMAAILLFCSHAVLFHIFNTPVSSRLRFFASLSPRQAVMLLKFIKQPHNILQHFLFRLFSFFLFSFQVFVIVIVVAFPKPDFLDFF